MYSEHMRYKRTLTLLLALTPTLITANEEKMFMNCGLEAEVVMQVIDSKIKDEPLQDLIAGWQNSLTDVLKAHYVKEMVTYAYINYPMMTKLEIANLQLKFLTSTFILKLKKQA